MALPAPSANHGLGAGLLAALLTAHPNVEARRSPDEAPHPPPLPPPDPIQPWEAIFELRFGPLRSSVQLNPSLVLSPWVLSLDPPPKNKEKNPGWVSPTVLAQLFCRCYFCSLSHPGPHPGNRAWRCHDP